MQQSSSHEAENRAIVEIVQELSSNPGLLDELRADPTAVLTRLNLTGVARHAIASVFVLGVTPVAMQATWWW